MFTGDENHSIKLTEAADLTRNYRNSVPAGSTNGHFFGKTALEEILNNDSCVGLRIYYAQTSGGEKRLVITGVDENENDIIDERFLADRNFPCPPMCGSGNVLNS